MKKQENVSYILSSKDIFKMASSWNKGTRVLLDAGDVTPIPKQPTVTSGDIVPPSPALDNFDGLKGISSAITVLLDDLRASGIVTNPKIKSELDKYLGDSVVTTPQRSYQDPDEPASTTGTMLDAAPMPTDSYVIKSGDTMGKIAANNPFTLTQLIASNPQIEDPNKIEVGQQLNFPPVGVAKAGQIPASTGTQQSVVSTTKILDDWGKLYQTENDPTKNTRAANAIAKTYTVPKEAQNSIEVAATVFEGDKGFSKESLIEYGKAIGQIESSYTTKVQRGGGPARSYWQVEPKTALSLVKNSSGLFKLRNKKSKFEQEFEAKYAKPARFDEDGNVMDGTALEYLQSLSEAEMSDVLEKDGKLAATLALAKVVNRKK